MLLGIGNAAVDPLHDLLLKIRFTESYQNADLIFFTGKIERSAQCIGLKVQFRHNGPYFFRRLRLDLTAVMQHPIYRARDTPALAAMSSILAMLVSP